MRAHSGAAVTVGLLCFLVSCATTSKTVPTNAADVEHVLDGFHRAASQADERTYFGSLASSAIFFGTDATERWSREDFLAYAHPYFEKGKGWTFTPLDRHVYFSQEGRTAWFDERLDSASYGECRGTGVLEKQGTEWKIQQYNLTIPIPNSLAKEFVAKIRESGTKK